MKKLESRWYSARDHLKLNSSDASTLLALDASHGPSITRLGANGICIYCFNVVCTVAAAFFCRIGVLKAAERKFGRKSSPIVSIFFRISAPQPPRAVVPYRTSVNSAIRLETERPHPPRSRAERRGIVHSVQVGIVPNWSSRLDRNRPARAIFFCQATYASEARSQQGLRIERLLHAHTRLLTRHLSGS